MNELAVTVLAELRSLIAELGKNGGMMSPSVYDTAQVLRFSPSRDAHAAVNWLVEQQRADGGWGDPLIPIARPAPTLAAMLALRGYAQEKRVREALAAGQDWLMQAGNEWPEELPNGMPVGVELILPRLLQDAQAVGFEVNVEPYAKLMAVGKIRRDMIAGLPIRPGTTAAHSWEAWGQTPDPTLMDVTGSIGHSPAATAAWLHAARQVPELRAACRRAEAYLEQAVQATGVNLPGVVPTAWPIDRFEQSNALYAILLAGLLDHPELQDVVGPQVADLNRAIGATGIGFTDWFDPDGDDTAMALAVVGAAHQPQTLTSLQNFAVGDHYCAYQGELQPSPSVVAHALHAGAIFGETGAPATLDYLVAQQSRDGRWISDKWNASWLYTTSHALFALQDQPNGDVVQTATNALLDSQTWIGAWGAQRISVEETGYSLLALTMLAQRADAVPGIDRARDLAKHWLIANHRPYEPVLSACWQAKEIFRPMRIARAYELGAVFQSAIDEPELIELERGS